MSSACPDPTRLEELASGKLRAESRTEIEAHVEGCRECTTVIAELVRLYGSELTTSSLPYAQTIAIGNASRSDSPPSPMVGRYRMGERLGEGGMGVVFLAHDPELDRRVAVKLLHPDPDGNLDAQRSRLMREAQAMAKLSHPNVVAVHDVGRLGDQLFLAMELVDGTTLTRWLQTATRTRDEIVTIFAQAGRGLAAAHAVGLVHRDFKPDNVLVGRDDRARVTDFGVARPLGVEARAGLAAALDGSTHALVHTIPGALVGTPAYMAPEQLRSEPADARSDQFAFCVSLYEALFGARPFAGASLPELARNVLDGKITPPPSSAPRWLRAILLRGLAIDPAARFPSIDALLAELTRDHGRARRLALTGASMLGGALAIVAVLNVATRARSSPAAAASSSGAPSAFVAGVAPKACAEARRDPHETWGSAQKKRVDEAFDVEKPAWSREIVTKVETGLDAWLQAWTSERSSVCSPIDAAVVETKDDIARAELACLELDGRVFGSLVDELARSDAGASEHAIEAIESLPSPSQCASASVARFPPLFADVDKQSRAALLDVELAQLWARTIDGRLLDTWQDAKRLVDVAKSLGEPSIVARVNWVAGHHALLSLKGELALQRLQSAATAAEAVGDGDLIAASAIDLVVLEGSILDQQKEAARWQSVAESELARAGSDPRGRARLAAALGGWHARLGKWIEAKASYQAALDSWVAIDGGSSFVPRARVDLSRALLAVRDLDAADRQTNDALAEARAFGDHDPMVATASIAVGDVLLERGSFDDALSAFETAKAIRNEKPHLYNAELARAIAGSARALAKLGKVDDATSAFEEEDRILQPRALLDDPEAARGLLDLSTYYVELSKLADARDRAADALACLDRMGAPADDPVVADAHVAVSIASLRSGDTTKAITEARSAIALFFKRFSDNPPRAADAQWTLGLALEKTGALADADSAFASASWALRSGVGDEHPRFALLEVDRARVALARGDRAQARTYYVDAAKILAAAFGEGDARVKEVRVAIAKLGVD